jgi:hypothetical protein
MKMQQVVAAGLAMLLASAPIVAAGQQTATMAGIAKKEAKKPYTDYTTRARNVQTGEIAGTAPNADPDASFNITGLPPANYLIELLDKNGKIVCTEGPFNMTQQFVKNDIDISCHHLPAAWWLLFVAAGTGVTAGAAIGTQSASQ